MAAPATYEDFNFIVNWGGTNQRMMSVSPLMETTVEYRDGDTAELTKGGPRDYTLQNKYVLERRLPPQRIPSSTSGPGR